MKKYIEKLLDKEDLTIEESYTTMNLIMSGSVDNSNLAGFLIALKAKGESPEEVAGFAKAMRDNCIKINSSGNNVIDVCGTGGDNSGTFNISTAVAFVAAGAGVKVAKHGNRSISSKCGSADVLQQLGININLTKEQSEDALEKAGITFLFAPLYHPAMRHAAKVRKELGIKTVFNLLGPLTNPAGVKKQIIGTFSIKAARTMSGAVKYLEHEKVCFVCCNDKFDEVHLGDETSVFEYNGNSKISEYKINNEIFGYSKTNYEDIKGDSAERNAEIILDILERKIKSSAYYTVAANAALALYVSGYSDDLVKCAVAAEESILSGEALSKLNELKKLGVAKK
ncbi:MAG: anthranilate phosphoribosyltransferase [Ignavibacteria bacterium RBG_16_34_14]|nr:MAG: anthranilate phosphoribosyltransferase [Ignavibacteria bacterium RBG_16_34_14]